MASNSPPSAPIIFEKELRKYIPKELIPDTWKYNEEDPDSLQNLLKNPQLGMFESAKELLTDINLSANIPKFIEYFGMKDLDEFQEGIVDKCDVYNVFDACPLEGGQRHIAWMILELCWKHVKDISRKEGALVLRDSEPPSLLNVRPFNIKYRTFNGFLSRWRMDSDKILKGLGEQTSVLERFLGDFPEDDPKHHKKQFTICKDYAEAVMDCASKCGKPPTTWFIGEKRAPIRIFSFDGNTFVMAHELLKTLKENVGNAGEIEQEILGMPKLSTFTEKEVDKLSVELWNELEFREVHVVQLMFRQTPIPTYYEGYCTLAVDVLYELLVDMIVAKKVFHTFQPDIWPCIIKFFEGMEFYFDPTRRIYFLDSKDVDAIKKMWEYVYNTKLRKHYPNVKHFPRTKKTEFRFEELEKTLEYLNLKKSCEGIEKYARPVYDQFHVYRRCDSEAEERLFLSELHVAVTRCQINYVVEKVPSLLKFIKKQGALRRMNIVELRTEQEQEQEDEQEGEQEDEQEDEELEDEASVSEES